jgi:hypothetical protein
MRQGLVSYQALMDNSAGLDLTPVGSQSIIKHTVHIRTSKGPYEVSPRGRYLNLLGRYNQYEIPIVHCTVALLIFVCTLRREAR